MSYKDSAHKNLLMGVSQQAPQDRLPGQLSEQLNMISDPVTGLRRRPGTEFIKALLMLDLGDKPRPKVYHTDINNRSVVFLVFPHLGSLYVFDDQTGELLQSYQDQAYLKSASAQALRLVTMGDEVFIANTGIKPSKLPATAGKNPDRFGYFYIPAGQYAKDFTITFTNSKTGASYIATYTTPDGKGESDAQRTSVHAIAWQLYGKIYGRAAQKLPNDPMLDDPARPAVTADPALQPIRDATVASGLSMGYVGLQLSDAWSLTITSNTGSGYLRTSGDMTIRASDELPASLPTTADYPATSGGTAFMDGVIVAAGTSANLTYFRWDAGTGRWKEDAAYGDGTGFQNMPHRLRWDSAGWAFGMPEYLKRPAGDIASNPDFNFLKSAGITGMTTFQGRLVFLSNEYACMSASNDPLRWYKRSATALADDDPVEVAAQGTLTAPYQYGITYNKDLILFSRRYQAVIPGGGVITPRTASLSVTTTYEADMSAVPFAAGRSLYFATPRSLGFVGIHEMSPSPSTDSHYVADDVTSHIPSYIPGPAAYITGASTSGFLVTGSDVDPADRLTVYQYIWAGADKVQQAWHRWELHKQILGVYFSGDTMMCIVYGAGQVILLRLNLRALTGQAGLPAPRYDMQRKVVCSTAGHLAVDTEYFSGVVHDLRVYRVTPGVGQFLERRIFEPVEVVGGQTSIPVPEAEVGHEYIIGHGYESMMEPSPPVVRDYNGAPITTTRATLRGYRVSYKDTGEFEYKIGDSVRPGQWIDTTPLRLFSRRLDAGQPFVDTAVVPLPARVDMLTSSLVLRADGPYDMNVSSLEYGYKHNQRHRRA